MALSARFQDALNQSQNAGTRDQIYQNQGMTAPAFPANSYTATALAPQVPGLTFAQPLPSLAGPQPISTNAFSNTSPLTMPQIMPNTVNAGVIAGTNPFINNAVQTINSVNEAVGVNQNDANRNAADTYLQSLFGQKSDIQTGQVTSPDQQKFDAKQAELDVVDASVADLKKQQRAEQDAARNQATTQEGYRTLASNIDEKYSRKIADKGIEQAVLGNSLSRLQTSMDKKTEMLLAGVDTQIQYYTNYVEKNLDRLDDRSKANAATILSQLNAEKAQVQKDQDAKTAILSEAMKNGVQIPANVLAQFTAAKTSAEAAQILASNGISLQDPLDVQLKRANIEQSNAATANSYSQIEERGAAAKKAGESSNYSISKESLNNSYGGDVVSVIAGTIKNSGAKQSQSTNDAINVIAGLQSLVKSNSDGTFTGVGPIHARDIFSSKEAIANRSDLEAINLKVQQWASGAALTDAQTAQVEKMTPRASDTDKQVRAKTNALTNYMISQVSGQLAGQGVGFNMDKVDLFDKSKSVPMSSYIDSVDSVLKGTPDAYSTAGYKL